MNIKTLAGECLTFFTGFHLAATPLLNASEILHNDQLNAAASDLIRGILGLIVTFLTRYVYFKIDKWFEKKKTEKDQNNKDDSEPPNLTENLILNQ